MKTVFFIESSHDAKEWSRDSGVMPKVSHFRTDSTSAPYVPPLALKVSLMGAQSGRKALYE